MIRTEGEMEKKLGKLREIAENSRKLIAGNVQFSIPPPPMGTHDHLVWHEAAQTWVEPPQSGTLQERPACDNPSKLMRISSVAKDAPWNTINSSLGHTYRRSSSGAGAKQDESANVCTLSRSFRLCAAFFVECVIVESNFGVGRWAYHA